jgi:hypothetical protein
MKLQELLRFTSAMLWIASTDSTASRYGSYERFDMLGMTNAVAGCCDTHREGCWIPLHSCAREGAAQYFFLLFSEIFKHLGVFPDSSTHYGALIAFIEDVEQAQK